MSVISEKIKEMKQIIANAKQSMSEFEALNEKTSSSYKPILELLNQREKQLMDDKTKKIRV